MNIYNAIMKAANHIERHPGEFDFNQIPIPGACGTPGCALGWIGFFYGTGKCAQLDNGYNGAHAVAVLLGFSNAGPFYHRMGELDASRRWSCDPSLCARTLRLYAAKYHTLKSAVPDWNAMSAKQTVSIEARSQELVS
jgi:hypothetical protein